MHFKGSGRLRDPQRNGNVTSIIWADTDCDPARKAFYCVRVIIPDPALVYWIKVRRAQDVNLNGSSPRTAFTQNRHIWAFY